MNRRTFLLGGAATVAAFGVGTVGYTLGIEPHWLELVERDLPIEHLPPALDGRTLAQITDVHVGPQVSDDYLVESFARVRAFSPDIVVFTGDFISYRVARGDSQFSQLRDVLTHMPRGRLGTVGVLGNHDYGRGWQEVQVAENVAREAERAGIQILRNDVANIAGLDVIGVDDLWSRYASAQTALGRRGSNAALALCHNPDGLDVLDWTGYRGWVLAGHTHGGQCKPPFLPAPLLPVKNRRYSSGVITVNDDRQLYISRGVGHLIQARFNVRPEITIFTLRSVG